MTISKQLREILSELTAFEDAAITPDAHLNGDLQCDELDLVEIVMALEEEFGIEITDDDAERFVHVQDIQAYLDQHAVVKKR